IGCRWTSTKSPSVNAGDMLLPATATANQRRRHQANTPSAPARPDTTDAHAIRRGRQRRLRRSVPFIALPDPRRLRRLLRLPEDLVDLCDRVEQFLALRRVL